MILAWWIGVESIIGSSWAVSFIWGEVNMEKDQQIGMENGGLRGGLLWLQMGLTSGSSWVCLEEFGDIYWRVFG